MPPTVDTTHADNATAFTSGSLSERLIFWCNGKIDQRALTSAQYAAIFSAGQEINNNHQSRLPERFQEIALRYKELVNKMRQDKLITNAELDKSFRVVKGASTKTKKGEPIVTEYPGWPAGKQLWSKYQTIRKNIREDIRSLAGCPKNPEITGSGKSLKQAMSKVALKLYKDPTHNKTVVEKMSAEDLDKLSVNDDNLIKKIMTIQRFPHTCLLSNFCHFNASVIDIVDAAGNQKNNKPKTRDELNEQNAERRERRAKM